MHSRERISQNLSLDRMLIDFAFRDGKRAILARLVNKLALFSLVEQVISITSYLGTIEIRQE
jgi:hypothetical protein